MSSIPALANNRGMIDSKVKRLEEAFEEHGTTPLNTIELHDILASLLIATTELEAVQLKLCSKCTEQEIGTHQTAYEALLKRCDILRRGCKRALPQHQQQAPPPLPPPGGPQKFKLQKLELPTFDGDVLKWMSFSNSFTAAVHSNTLLTESEKLQYLKSSVTGEAASRIDAFPIDEASFALAWEVLMKRYEDKKAIVQAILKRLFIQPPIQQDSATCLRKFVDIINECMRSLRVMTIPTVNWDPVVLFFLVEKLYADTRKQWELTRKAEELPTIVEFTDFIEMRARSLSSLPTTKVKAPFKGPNNKLPPAGGKVLHVAATPCINCPSETHNLFACPVFRKATVQDRWEQVKKCRGCFNCTVPGHSTQDCTAGSCKKCDKKHHTMLHADRAPAKKKEDDEHPLNVAHAAASLSTKETGQVLLGTALIRIPDAKGTLHEFRALIDPGSQITLISEKCKQQVGLKSIKTHLALTGVGAMGLGTASELVKLNIVSCIDSNYSLCVNAVVLPRVTGPLPNALISKRNWSHLNGLQLADPTFHTPSSVDILLGADVCASIMKDGMRRGPGGTPTAWNSALGWILIGTVHPTPSVKIHLTEPQLGDALERFWHQEEIPASSILTPEEKACEEHFAAHHVRTNNRYEVELPFKEDPSVLGSSRYTALRRLYSLERQLSKVPSRYAEYADFLDTCQKLGHMELVPEDEVSNPLHYYLPHHAVIKEESTSTKLRVVFSGKDPTSTGKSLNDILMVGPKLQPDLITTIIRFCTFLIAFTADIVKMYRQVKVAPHHRDYQRIVWRGTPKEPVRDYRLTTVTYGTSSAPYQAVKALLQLALDFKAKFPIASKVILKSFYVDDLLSGASSVQEATNIYNELMKIMKKGGFELRKWASNNASFLKTVPPEYRGTSSPQIIEEDEAIKTLGIKWHPCEDYFSFDVLQYEERGPVTKRIILSDTLKTFDPCGSLAPVTVKAKMFLQKLWKNSCKWDDPLPSETQESWKMFHQELKGLEKLKIHRCINLENSVKYHLHGFCDASEKAFAAAVYLRCETEDGTVQVRLIASKTKVAPIKPIQLPRLELCSSVLLVRLLAIITPALDSIQIDEVHAWSDSNIALCWIAAHPSRWKTFIANRVTEIQESTQCSWHHVRSEDNPADCASRGIAVTDLLNHPLWWEGPPWLRSNSFPIQHSDETEPEGALVEEKKQLPLVVHISKNDSMLHKFSSLITLRRVTAYCYRFSSNCKLKNEDRLSGPLTVEELNRALSHWPSHIEDDGPVLKGKVIKFGWLEGVLMRCLLNIWGVMLFLRLSWLIGQAGTVQGILIISLANLVTFITAFSMSAVSTNGQIKGGGIYYMISRSLGPEFGAAIGLMFTIANSIAVSLYIVGFCESLNDLLSTNGWGNIIDGGSNDVRVVGVGILVLILILAFVGMDWVTRTQMFLLVVLIAAQVDFIVGTFIGPVDDKEKAQGFTGYSGESWAANAGPDYRKGLDGDDSQQDFFSVFGVFFPAVTGIVAGANLSGDLKDPGSAIPKGTLLAIIITYISYIGYGIMMAGCVMREASGNVTEYVMGLEMTREEIYANGSFPYDDCFNRSCEYGLLNNAQVMELTSSWGPLIYMGCFAATLSSAIASLVGAPRVLQALAKDKLYPLIYFFAKGYGANNDPVRGYLLVFAISLGCLLIASLNAIAPLLSNFFLAAYCLINFSVFHASITKSPGWRPSFKYYNAWVSLLGSILCVAVMFLMSWVTALITVAVSVFLYLYVSYRGPEVNWGSSTQAQSYNSALKSVQDLNHVEEHVKNYRPQILVFSGMPSARPPLIDFSYLIVKNVSLLICSQVVKGPYNQKVRNALQRQAYNWLAKHKKKAFYTLIEDESFERGAHSIMQIAGLGRLKPNMVMMGYKSDWHTCNRKDLMEYFHIIHEALDMHLAVGLLRTPEGLDYSSLIEEEDQMTPLQLLDSKKEKGNIPRNQSESQLSQDGTSSEASSPPSSPKIERANIGGGVVSRKGSSEPKKKRNRKVSASAMYKGPGGAVIPRDVLANVTQFQRKQKKGTIDVWWLYDDGGLTILLPYILSTRSQFAGCQLRIFSLTSRKDELGREQRNMAALLAKFRIDYSDVIVIPDITKKAKDSTKKEFEALIAPLKSDDAEEGTAITSAEIIALREKTNRHLRLRELLLEHSKESTFVVMTLPMPRKGTVSAPLYMAWLETITKGMPPFLLARGNQTSVLTFYS